MASFLGFDPPSNLRVGGSNPSRRAFLFLRETGWCPRGVLAQAYSHIHRMMNITSVRNRGGARLLDAGRETNGSAPDDRCVVVVADTVSIHIALLVPGHRLNAPIRRKTD